MTTGNAQGTVDEALGDYELTMIVRPDASEEETQAAVERVSRYVSDRGGEVVHVDNWGRRRLSYPIRHFGEGAYFMTRFRLRPEHNRELESSLRISEDVIRHLLIKRD